jgi:hypothetical protein
MLQRKKTPLQLIAALLKEFTGAVRIFEVFLEFEKSDFLSQLRD